MGNEASRQCPGMFGDAAVPKPIADEPSMADEPVSEEQKIEQNENGATEPATIETQDPATSRSAKDKKAKKKKKKDKKSKNANEDSKAVLKTGHTDLQQVGDDAKAPAVKSLTHHHHATFDKKTGTFHGIPDEWLKKVNQQFGLPLSKVESEEVDPYEGKIPSILVKLKSYLVRRGGLTREGIFRISPSEDELKELKEALDKGMFKNAKQIHSIPVLIKRWYKQLPEPILTPVPAKKILETKDDKKKIGKLIKKLPEPNKSVFLWLLDLLVDVSNFHKQNKMNARNLAVVVAPNLYVSPSLKDLDAKEPTAVLEFANNASRWLMHAIMWRQETRPSFLDTMDNFVVDRDSTDDTPTLIADAPPLKPKRDGLSSGLTSGFGLSTNFEASLSEHDVPSVSLDDIREAAEKAKKKKKTKSRA